MAQVTKDMTFPKGWSHAEDRTVSANKYARARRQILAIRPNLILGGFTVSPVIKGDYDSKVIDVQGGLRNETEKKNPGLVAAIGDGDKPASLDAQIEYERMFEGTLDATFGKATKGVWHFDMDPVHMPKIIAVQSVEDMQATADAMEGDLKRIRQAIAALK